MTLTLNCWKWTKHLEWLLQSAQLLIFFFLLVSFYANNLTTNTLFDQMCVFFSFFFFGGMWSMSQVFLWNMLHNLDFVQYFFSISFPFTNIITSIYFSSPYKGNIFKQLYNVQIGKKIKIHVWQGIIGVKQTFHVFNVKGLLFG